MKLKKNFLLFFFLLSAVLVGGMVASLCANISFLSWLAFGGTVGFAANNPFVLDLWVLKLTFGFSMTITVAQIITIALSLFLYKKWVGR